MVAALREQGQLVEALKCMERGIVLRQHLFGNEADEVWARCAKCSALCNTLAMVHLEAGEFADCDRMLRKAEVLAARTPLARAAVLNNRGCYHRRRNELHAAARALTQALAIEEEHRAACDAAVAPEQSDGAGSATGGGHGGAAGGSLADTHMNMCVVLSELKRHRRALEHAQAALALLRDELGFGAGAVAGGGASSGMGVGVGGRTIDGQGDSAAAAVAPERVAVYGAACLNLATELSILKRAGEAHDACARGLRVCRARLPTSHPMLRELRASAKVLGRVAAAARGELNAAPTKPRARAQHVGAGQPPPAALERVLQEHGRPRPPLRRGAAKTGKQLLARGPAVLLAEERPVCLTLEAGGAAASGDENEEDDDEGGQLPPPPGLAEYLEAQFEVLEEDFVRAQAKLEADAAALDGAGNAGLRADQVAAAERAAAAAASVGASDDSVSRPASLHRGYVPARLFWRRLLTLPALGLGECALRSLAPHVEVDATHDAVHWRDVADAAAALLPGLDNEAGGGEGAEVSGEGGGGGWWTLPVVWRGADGSDPGVDARGDERPTCAYVSRRTGEAQWRAPPPPDRPPPPPLSEYLTTCFRDADVEQTGQLDAMAFWGLLERLRPVLGLDEEQAARLHARIIADAAGEGGGATVPGGEDELGAIAWAAFVPCAPALLRDACVAAEGAHAERRGWCSVPCVGHAGGDSFWHNKVTGVSQWDAPGD
eukprot:g1073.t1